MPIKAGNVIPKMTSNTAPSGAASCSSVFSSAYDSWYAFNQISDQGWASSGTATAQWLCYKFTNPVAISQYTITSRNSSTSTDLLQSPKTWRFEASNDGSTWTTIDERDNVTNWGVAEKRVFTFNNIISFIYYRIYCISNNGSTTAFAINELEMMEYDFLNKFLIYSEGDSLSFTDGKKSNITSIPTMTSDTAPSGRAFAGSVYSTSYPPWKAFNGIDDAEGYVSASGSAGVGYLGYEFPEPISLYKYVVRSCDTTHLNKMPKDWTFEGSNDGTNWTVVDRQTNQTWTTRFTDNEYILEVSNHFKKFKMYRLNWTANNGWANYTDVNELKMFEIIPPKLTKLPSTSEETFARYGMKKGASIDLNVGTNLVSVINTSHEALGSGKLFRQPIDRSKYPTNKIRFN